VAGYDGAGIKVKIRRIVEVRPGDGGSPKPSLGRMLSSSTAKNR
jgi:hypothetical protein